MIYKPTGVCSREITIDIDEETSIVKAVNFKGGCSGNASGISRLVVGMPIDEVIQKLEGITCDYRPTSCPDQLAKALKKWRSEE